MKTIYKVAGVEIKDDSFLMVRKSGKEIWTNLGGKPKTGESDKEALKREINEELGCDVIIKKKLGKFENQAAFDDAIIQICFYLVELVGEPVISDDELEEFAYISSSHAKEGIKLPPSITEQLIPLLIEKEYLKWRLR